MPTNRPLLLQTALPRYLPAHSPYYLVADAAAMKDTRTSADNIYWWQRQAERYQRAAARAKTEKERADLLNRASLATANAIASAS